MEIMNKRINNLEFRKCSYIGSTPENASYTIDYWYPNRYYGKESEYIKNGAFYKEKNQELSYFSIHESCFKNPESCYSLAHFIYDSKEENYYLEFIGDRPLDLNKEERDIFFELLKYGYDVLNNSSKYTEGDETDVLISVIISKTAKIRVKEDSNLKEEAIKQIPIHVGSDWDIDNIDVILDNDN